MVPGRERSENVQLVIIDSENARTTPSAASAYRHRVQRKPSMGGLVPWGGRAPRALCRQEKSTCPA